MSNKALGFPFGFYVADNSPVDSKYGVIDANVWRPYNNLAEALSLLPSGIRYKGLTINIADKEYWWKAGITNADLIEKSSGAGGIIDTTYDALKTLKDAGNLAPGQLYRFAFQTVHQIQSTTVINTGVAENFIIQAIGTNRFNKQVASELYPQDIIEYDFDSALAEDGVTARPGEIMMRRDTVKNIITFYDWRNVKYRVWKTSLHHHVAAKNSNVLASATIIYGNIDAAPYVYREYYIDFNAFLVHDANPQLSLTKGATTVAREIVKPNGTALVANEINVLLGTYKFARVYYSPTHDKYVIVNNQSETDLCSWYMGLQSTDFTIGNGTRLTVSDPNDFQDVYTFASANPLNAHDVYIARKADGAPNRIVWLTDGGVNLVHIYEDCYDVVFKNGNTEKFIIAHNMQNCRFSGSVQYGRVGNECWNILGLATGLARMSWTTGCSSHDSWCNNVSVFSIGNWFNAAFDHALNSTIRIGGGNNADFVIHRMDGCIFNFQSKTIGQVNITGCVFYKFFEDGTVLNSTTWLGGTDVEIKTYGAADLENVTLSKNPVFILGNQTKAGEHKIGIWNTASKSYLRWNPTANRNIDIPDLTGMLAVIQPVSSGNTIILNGLPTSNVGLPSGAIWNDGGVLKIAP